jgi:hypothetical protein
MINRFHLQIVKLHYEKSHPWKFHCLATKNSYEITMQLNHNYLLEIK